MKISHSLPKANAHRGDPGLCVFENPTPIAVQLLSERYRISQPHATTVAQLAGIGGFQDGGR